MIIRGSGLIGAMMLVVAGFSGSPAMGQSATELLELGREARNSGNLPEAERLLRQAFRKSPDNADIALFLGLALNGLDRYAEAEELLRPFVARFPDYAGLEMALARALIAQGELDEADRRATSLHRRFPDRPDVRALQARSALALGRTAEAEAAYAALLQDDPGHRAGLVGHVDTALAMQDAGLAERRLERLAADYPGDPAIAPRRSRLNDLKAAIARMAGKNEKWVVAGGYRFGDFDDGLKRHAAFADVARVRPRDVYRLRLDVDSRANSVDAFLEGYVTPWKSEIYVPTLRAGAGPGNDFLPDWRLGGDVKIRVRNADGAFPVTVLDAGILATGVSGGVAERFSLGARQWIDIGYGEFSATFRGFLTNDENGGNLLGWVGQLDLRSPGGWAWRAGYGVGPEDSEGSTIVIRTAFGSVEAPLADQLSLIASLSREDIKGVTDRYFAGLTLKAEF